MRTAFRRLAAQYHPDLHPNDSQANQRFAEINAAYHILVDAEKRAAWDRYGEAAFRPGGAPVGFNPADLLPLDGVLGDILGAFGVHVPRAGDVRVKLTIEFVEAALGCDKPISYEVRELCSRCSGRGGEPNSPTNPCGSCEGRGQVRSRVPLPWAAERPCPACHGSGRRAVRDCTTCRGSGLLGVRRNQTIQIPPGVEAASTRRLRGEGSRATPTSPAGDLIVEVDVIPHSVFRRVEDDIICPVSISFVQAALGGEVEIPTLTGTAKLRIPPATQSGSVLRLRGMGIPKRLRTGRGDQLAEIRVEVPQQLSERARQLVADLGAELGAQPNPQPRTLRERLRDWWG